MSEKLETTKHNKIPGWMDNTLTLLVLTFFSPKMKNNKCLLAVLLTICLSVPLHGKLQIEQAIKY